MKKPLRKPVAGQCKVTPAQRQQLLEYYLKYGMKATEPLCKELGVSNRYPASVASVYGKRRPKYRAGTKYKDTPKADPAWNQHDPRWAWAIERGTVIA